ncbi:hypothetical protein F5X68DRAFT_191390 [Plectosphaerella plurivora]|uniref:Uncharacterized protein n=1 Tax=Plectosphaerella plurivora TaxID=936078 RepID=A0A9P8VBJ2_9PEZI|nr:hypothetical protein F5X68DRAFT_191390 [Plectosphaerella plurivora]
MGGKYWTAAEEHAFWTEIVPRAVYGRERPTEASFGPHVARMREIGDPSRRNYNAVAMYEHWHLNAVQGTLSPNVGNHVYNYSRNDAARMRAQGVMPSGQSEEGRANAGTAAQVPRAQPPIAQGPTVQSHRTRTPEIPAFDYQPPNAQGPSQPRPAQSQEESDVVFISARSLYGEADQNETSTATKQDRFLSKLDASMASAHPNRSLANSAKMPNWVVYYDDQSLAPGDAASVPEERGGVWRFRDQTLESQHDKTGEKGKKLEEVVAPAPQRTRLPSAQPQRQPQQPLEPPVDDSRERERRYREAQAAQQQQMEMRLQEAARQDRERQEREWRQNEAERQRLLAEREALANYGRQPAQQPQMGWHPAPPQHDYYQGGQLQGGYQQPAPPQGGHPYAGYQPGGYHQGAVPQGGYQALGPYNGQGSYYGSDPAFYQMGRAPGQYNHGYSGYGPAPGARSGEEELRRQQEKEDYSRWQIEEERRRQQRKE